MTPDPRSPQPDPPDRHAAVPSQASTADTPGQSADGAHAAHEPAHIGPYIVRRLIAGGGMGNVYECLDERLGKLVAVKVAHPDLATRPSVLADIRDEARRLASVKDTRYVCRVLSAGDVKIGGVSVPWVAMDYEQDAETLGGPHSNAWALERKVEFFVKVCSAVRALHDQHLVHADIKPANILVVGDEPRLIDFGIARVVKRLGGERAHLLAGTPGYLDPALGGRADARPDQRSDIYALGLTLAEFITGRPPEFGGGGAPTTSPLAARPPGSPEPPGAPEPREREIDAILDAMGITLDEFSSRPSPNPVEQGTPIWPSRQSPPSRANPAIDRELDGILLRAIDPDPGRRFQSVAELAGRLEEWRVYRRALPVRIADRARAASRYGSMLLVRSRVVGLLAIAVLAGAIAFACTLPLFYWTPLASLTQRIDLGAVGADDLSEVRVIDGSDTAGFIAACERHGTHISMNETGGVRRTWATLARKLAGAGRIRAVGFDLFFREEGVADDELRSAWIALAAQCQSGSVILPLNGWNGELIPSLRAKGSIRVACAILHAADANQPPLIQLAMKPSGEQIVCPSFALLLACAHARPDREPRVSFGLLNEEVILDFETQDTSGRWTRRAADRIVLTGQHIQTPDPARDGVELGDGDKLAWLPVQIPSQKVLSESTKSAADILEMSVEDLRLWIGNRVVIVGGNEEKQDAGNNRPVFGVYFNAAGVQAIIMQRFMRIPGIVGASLLAVSGGILGAALGWVAWAFSRRSSTARAVMLAAICSVAGIVTTIFGCMWLGMAAQYFINPIIICLAVTLAVIAVVALGRGTRALLNTDL